MNPMYYLKAIIGALLAGLAVLADGSVNGGTLHTGNYVMAGIAALTAFSGVFSAGNKKQNSTTESAANPAGELQFPVDTITLPDANPVMQSPEHVAQPGE